MGNAPDQFQPVCFTSDLICFQLKEKKHIRFMARFFVIIAFAKASFLLQILLAMVIKNEQTTVGR